VLCQVLYYILRLRSVSGFYNCYPYSICYFFTEIKEKVGEKSRAPFRLTRICLKR